MQNVNCLRGRDERSRTRSLSLFLPYRDGYRMKIGRSPLRVNAGSRYTAPMATKRVHTALPKKLDGNRAALAYLKKADPILYAAALAHYAHVRDFSSAEKRYGSQKLFAALAGSVTGQQLSTKAADTIWGRLETACGGTVTPEAIARLRLPTLRKAGLSAAKSKTLKELSRAVRSGELDLAGLRKLPEEEAILRLNAIWGIGTWTAEMFLIFALGRSDVFSVGDLGLVRAMEALYGIPMNSKREVYTEIAAKWSPHRSFASLILWRTRDNPS
ncbi:MAG: HhH-GPD family protein [Parcubacteria group bacterium]|nr:HhH-GPD family protein [Parcubacteria group bacterium]